MPTFQPTLFQSFWQAGFESATHITRGGTRLDMMAATGHDRFVAEDYARLRGVRISTVRDTIRWHLVEQTPGCYDFSSIAPFVRAAREQSIEVIWDLLHYGWPDGLDIFSAAFVDRFARFSGAVARYLREESGAPLWLTPINELSFFAWAAGEVGWFHPFARQRGSEVKRQLVRAWIAGAEAIRRADPLARLVSVEPLIHTVPPRGQPDESGHAAAQREVRLAACGRGVGDTAVAR